jgi:hypothetical protein
VNDNTTISECFYPIVSTSNPAVQKIRDLEKKYGSLDDVPDDVAIEPPAQFSVVVKTTRYKKVGDIPATGIRTEPQVQGLLLKRVSALGYQEKKLIQDSFPGMKMDNVLVLEEGRRPSSTWWCFTRVGLGVLSILLGPVLAVVGVVMAFRNR